MEVKMAHGVSDKNGKEKWWGG